MSRYTHAQSILGAEAHSKIETVPILIVGAGGIGSELCELTSPPPSLPPLLSLFALADSLRSSFRSEKPGPDRIIQHHHRASSRGICFFAEKGEEEGRTHDQADLSFSLPLLLFPSFSRCFPLSQVDLDTIDLSNLNRQFLFRKPDISKPKALVAAATAKQFNPHVNIDARHSNIKDQEFDVNWVKKFALVFGALDNLGESQALRIGGSQRLREEGSERKGRKEEWS